MNLRHSRARVRVPRALAVLVAVVGLVVPMAQGASALVPTTFDKPMWGVDGRVRKIVQTDTAIYLGGSFNNLLGPNGEVLPRSNAAALDPVTGEPLPFAPNPNNAVWAMALSPDGSSLYLGGDFTKVAGVNRKRLAKVNTTTGAVSTWRVDANSQVQAIATRHDTVYVGGEFTLLGTTPRTRLAALDAATGAVSTTWLASADAMVHDLEFSVDGSRLFAGGLFTSVSGSLGNTQRRLTSLNPVTGTFQPWASHPGYEVFDVEATRTQVFAAAGGSGGHTMGYDGSTGALQWSAFSDGDAVGVELQNGVLYAGGHFTKWNGLAASHLIALNPATGAKLTWTVKINTALGIHSMDSHDGHLAIGGDFTKVNSLARMRIARFTEPADGDPPTAPGEPTGVSNTPTSIDLTWAGSTDNAAATILYRVYRDGGPAPVGQTSGQSGDPVTFTDTGLIPGTTHTYDVLADDGASVSDPSPTSLPITVQEAPVPVLVSLRALDSDTNGRVDTVTAQFSDPVSCTDPCLTPWTLSGFPAGTALSSVSVAGDTATLSLSEGTSVAQKTDVGSATVRLTADPAGIVGSSGNPSSFAATSPADGMDPVPVSMSSTNGGTLPGVMEPGDTFTVTFSEPINPASVIAANVKQVDPVGPGNDFENIVGLGDAGIDLGTDEAVLPDGGTIVYQSSTLTMSNSNKTITSTIVGLCTGTACGLTGTPVQPTTVTMRPEPFLRDVVGNGASGVLTAPVTLY